MLTDCVQKGGVYSYTSGQQPPGRGPVPVRQEFVTGPCTIFQVKCFETFF